MIDIASSLRCLVAAAMLSSLAACVSSSPPLDLAASASNTADAPARSLSATEQLAEDLIQAETAYQRDAMEELSRRLTRIDHIGARFKDTVEGDPALEWRAKSPDSAPPMRGRALGPAYTRGIVAAGKAIATEQIFLSGKSVAIAVGSPPEAAIRLRVIAADDKIVCERSPAHARDCRFLPIFTQRYRIELVNQGANDARYYLVVD